MHQAGLRAGASTLPDGDAHRAPCYTTRIAGLAVIIVSYNSERWLRACLNSLLRHRGTAQLEIVLVDNGSADASAELVEDEFPEVTILRGQNRGFAHANNRGLAVTDADFVLFLNPDTEIREGTLGNLIRLLDERPSVGLVGCRQITADGTLFPTIRRFPSPVRYFFEALGSERFPFRASWLGERELDPAAYDRETACDWVSGSFMLARREALIQAGLMDERYFLYCEETDLCAGIKAAGWDVRYLPDVTIFHDCGDSAHDARLVAQEAYSRRQYMFKHQGALGRCCCAAALACFYARRALAPTAGDPDARSARAGARSGLRTVLRIAPPPFGDLSGPLRGPKSSDWAAVSVNRRATVER